MKKIGATEAVRIASPYHIGLKIMAAEAGMRVCDVLHSILDGDKYMWETTVKKIKTQHKKR